MARAQSSRTILPGFGLSLGFTLAYLGLIVLAAALGRLPEDGRDELPMILSRRSPRRGCSPPTGSASEPRWRPVSSTWSSASSWPGCSSAIRFPGQRIIDALVDLPFALPTAVAGIALTTLYAPSGWLGRWLAPLGIKVAFTWTGVFVALTFIGLPFVVRTLQPVLEELEPEIEEAASTPGRQPLAGDPRVILPELLPSLLTGFALAFARALGEYGSVVFISGNMPMKTEIVPLLIITKLEQYDYVGATAIAVVMLVSSFVLLLLINLLQKWSRRYHAI